MKYNSTLICPYANGCFIVLPAGLENHFNIGDGTIENVDNDYFVCFRPGTSYDMKQRVTRDLKEYYAKESEKGYY